MPRPASALSLKAEGSIRGLYVSAHQDADGKTRLAVTWITRERGDEPGQGHRWTWSGEYPKGIKNVAHAASLVGWLLRRAVAGEWTKTR